MPRPTYSTRNRGIRTSNQYGANNDINTVQQPQRQRSYGPVGFRSNGIQGGMSGGMRQGTGGAYTPQQQGGQDPRFEQYAQEQTIAQGWATIALKDRELGQSDRQHRADWDLKRDDTLFGHVNDWNQNMVTHQGNMMTLQNSREDRGVNREQFFYDRVDPRGMNAAMGGDYAGAGPNMNHIMAMVNAGYDSDAINAMYNQGGGGGRGVNAAEGNGQARQGNAPATQEAVEQPVNGVGGMPPQQQMPNPDAEPGTRAGAQEAIKNTQIIALVNNGVPIELANQMVQGGGEYGLVTAGGNKPDAAAPQPTAPVNGVEPAMDRTPAANPGVDTQSEFISEQYVDENGIPTARRVRNPNYQPPQPATAQPVQNEQPQQQMPQNANGVGGAANNNYGFDPWNQNVVPGGENAITRDSKSKQTQANAQMVNAVLGGGSGGAGAKVTEGAALNALIGLDVAADVESLQNVDMKVVADSLGQFINAGGTPEDWLAQVGPSLGLQSAYDKALNDYKNDPSDINKKKRDEAQAKWNKKMLGGEQPQEGRMGVVSGMVENQKDQQPSETDTKYNYLPQTFTLENREAAEREIARYEDLMSPERRGIMSAEDAEWVAANEERVGGNKAKLGRLDALFEKIKKSPQLTKEYFSRMQELLRKERTEKEQDELYSLIYIFNTLDSQRNNASSKEKAGAAFPGLDAILFGL